ncbi:thyroid transcription factor 1-associated protein 26 [Echinops telfairi]|uniref:Thyroid transcription factor 1-associated protein 26 n=1 Tax=Echinops telfairi TaxID=9371 RepID=A0ABM0III9_ECHTE|nr:thyroid transcription factor 1-associated protein 26 [Echinops telfairi]
MAPVKLSSSRRAESLGLRGEAASPVEVKNRDVKQRRWRFNHPKAFVGSVHEGQGFALRRKLKIQQSYKKLLWKERKFQTSRESQFTDRYPDHLKHLYLAEKERLKKQNRKVPQPLPEVQVAQPLPEERASLDQAVSQEPCSLDHPLPEEQCSTTVNSFATRMKKKKKTSNQKAQEEYSQIQAKRAAKKQEFERRKQEREEAQRLYKKKKMEVFKILSKKTKKGQPNLNIQMEYLLQKIQAGN